MNVIVQEFLTNFPGLHSKSETIIKDMVEPIHGVLRVTKIKQYVFCFYLTTRVDFQDFKTSPSCHLWCLIDPVRPSDPGGCCYGSTDSESPSVFQGEVRQSSPETGNPFRHELMVSFCRNREKVSQGRLETSVTILQGPIHCNPFSKDTKRG